MKKLIDFTGLMKDIKDYADEHYEGNFSMAVRALIKRGLDNIKP